MPLDLLQLADALAMRINTAGWTDTNVDDGLDITAGTAGGDRRGVCLTVVIVEPVPGQLGGRTRTFGVEIKEDPPE
jgi:hypothetical protein